MNNTKKQIKEKTNITLLEEYKKMRDNGELSNYNGMRSYHTQNNQYRNINNGYGVELELNNKNTQTRDFLARYLNYKFKMNIEEDGSIDYYGMECITQPYTQNEWLSNKSKIKEFFELIKECELYENNSTGLHIHISKKLIGKNDTIRENNINKLILILENFKELFIKFSRRTRDNLYYCNYYSNYNSEKAYKDLYTIQKKKSYSHNVAINRDNKTYEIRIFKSTTNYEEFISTLQLVFNLVQIIQLEDLTTLTFNDIINYNKDFKELIKYCKDNKIQSNQKIIDKTKIKELLQLRENTKILKENYNYNRYIEKVRDIIINNLDLYNKSREEYNENNELYNNLRYIFTQTYRNNNSIYYQVNSINELLSSYNTKYIYNYKNNDRKEKRVFNPNYKNEYQTRLNKLRELIIKNGGVL